jgi:hypothetical protein
VAARGAYRVRRRHVVGRGQRRRSVVGKGRRWRVMGRAAAAARGGEAARRRSACVMGRGGGGCSWWGGGTTAAGLRCSEEGVKKENMTRETMADSIIAMGKKETLLFGPFKRHTVNMQFKTTYLTSDGQDNLSDVATGDLSLQTINAFSGDELYIYYRYVTMYVAVHMHASSSVARINQWPRPTSCYRTKQLTKDLASMPPSHAWPVLPRTWLRPCMQEDLHRSTSGRSATTALAVEKRRSAQRDCMRIRESAGHRSHVYKCKTLVPVACMQVLHLH